LFFFSFCMAVLRYFMETYVEQLGEFLVSVMALLAP
jgi:hypothetical protein